jgi:hypothetical protein
MRSYSVRLQARYLWICFDEGSGTLPRWACSVAESTLVVLDPRGGALMKHALKIAIALGMGAGLAAAAYAAGTNPPGAAPPGNVQSTAPAANTPGGTPPTNAGPAPQTNAGTAPQTNVGAAAPTNPPSTGPGMQTPRRHAGMHNLSGQPRIRGAQQHLRAEGFYRGRIDGVMGPGTRQAIARFQRTNRLPPTATLDRYTFTHLMGGRTGGFGSSMPPARSMHGPTMHGPTPSGKAAGY